ncbi:NADP-dependent aldehyde dehydrogenase [Stackebrandtia albiflava]|uniref:NADP-dependent aldehyde dehydrogenase n=1 Tax=Stackebrandtia albiflava TaxID=406432 RepID=A0A562V9N1_9ACTN|nr:aldehyde dehydrogenase family protein [Stackebrandtia albiflava]TWJ14590.1 NADP-dependent aldehyde dehydrogenase [Stackebrandtia albiflava]
MTETITGRAAAAAPGFAATPAARRRDLLHACAAALAAAGDEVVATAEAESGLTETRLRGELDRTVNQLRLLGDFVADGRHLPGIESPGAAPGGGDVMMASVPVGPVAVFAASNFPLAFGVAGGDTAAALAAGCPVVAKAHPAQPATSRLIAGIMTAHLPDGCFGLVEGGAEASIALVTDPAIKAVGFTGSLAGGRALMDAAATRPDPIPVYAEMGSLNPVFVLPDAASDTGWAGTLAAAVTGSAGQLCTKPGLIVLPDTDAGAALAAELSHAVAAVPAGHAMLTEAMADAHRAWLTEVEGRDGTVVTAAEPGDGARPFAVEVPPESLTGDLLVEHFGPAVVFSRVPVAEYADVVDRLEGSLTATLIGTDADHDVAAGLLPGLTGKAGRVIWNGVPTGVAVCDAMLHGGPWPATSAPWSTSVGTYAIARFRRPVALQGLPAALRATAAPA